MVPKACNGELLVMDNAVFDGLRSSIICGVSTLVSLRNPKASSDSQLGNELEGYKKLGRESYSVL